MKKLCLIALVVAGSAVKAQEFVNPQEAYRSITEDASAPESTRQLAHMTDAVIKNQEFLPEIRANQEIIKANQEIIKAEGMAIKQMLERQEKMLEQIVKAGK